MLDETGDRPAGAHPGAADGRGRVGVRRARHHRRQRRGDLRGRRLHPRGLLLQLRRQGRAGARADPAEHAGPSSPPPSRPIARTTSARRPSSTPPTWCALALAAFVEAGRPGRETILTERELLLYAARQPALRAPYLAFVAECDRQLAALIADALAYAGLEFTVPFDEGMTLLTATWNTSADHALFGAEPDKGPDAHPADGDHPTGRVDPGALTGREGLESRSTRRRCGSW